MHQLLTEAISKVSRPCPQTAKLVPRLCEYQAGSSSSLHSSWIDQAILMDGAGSGRVSEASWNSSSLLSSVTRLDGICLEAALPFFPSTASTQARAHQVHTTSTYYVIPLVCPLHALSASTNSQEAFPHETQRSNMGRSTPPHLHCESPGSSLRCAPHPSIQIWALFLKPAHQHQVQL